MTERGGEDVEALFRRYGPELRRHAARLLHGTSHEADDVLQEVTLRALARHGDAPLHLAHPRAWLHTCVQNACLSHLRSARSAPPPLSLEDEVAFGDQHDPHTLTARRAEAREVLEDLARLDVRQRHALLVSALGDGSHADVAVQLGGTERAVTSLVSRARGNLKAMRAARETPCSEIRAEIDDAAARGVRAPEVVRRHALSCRACRLYGEGRRRRSRIAGLLAPLNGLAAAVSQRLGEAAMPAAVDTGLAHGMAVVAVIAGGGAATAVHASGDARSAQGPMVATPVAHVVTVAERPTSVSVSATPTTAKRHVVVARHHPRKAEHAPREEAVALAPARPVKLNIFGCPQIQGTMTEADKKCRLAHRKQFRRVIEERLERQAADKAKAAAAAAVTVATTSAPAPTEPAPVPTAAPAVPLAAPTPLPEPPAATEPSSASPAPTTASPIEPVPDLPPAGPSAGDPADGPAGDQPNEKLEAGPSKQ